MAEDERLFREGANLGPITCSPSDSESWVNSFEISRRNVSMTLPVCLKTVSCRSPQAAEQGLGDKLAISAPEPRLATGRLLKFTLQLAWVGKSDPGKLCTQQQNDRGVVDPHEH